MASSVVSKWLTKRKYISQINITTYGVEHTRENCMWSANRTMNTCEGPLYDKVREGLIGGFSVKLGGPIHEIYA